MIHKYQALIEMLILPFTIERMVAAGLSQDQLSRVSYNRILQVRCVLHFLFNAIHSCIDYWLQSRIEVSLFIPLPYFL